MGLASDDLTGDGVPEVYVTSFADNKLQSLADGASRPAYENIAGDLGVGVAQPVGRRRAACPRRPGMPSSTTSTTTAALDLFVAKGNVEAMPENAMKDPSELLVAQPRRELQARRQGGRHPRLRAHRAAPPWPTSTSTGSSTSSRSSGPSPSASGATSARAPTPKPKSMGHWLGIELAQAGPNVDAIGSWIEVDRGDGTRRPRGHGRRRSCGRPAGPHAFRPRVRARQARVRVTWPDGEVGEWLDVDADARVLIERGSDASPSSSSTRHRGVTTARLAEVELPDFGMPTAMPELPRRDPRGAPRAGAGSAPRARAIDLLVVYADREHSANLGYLTGFDPRFEEAVLILGRGWRAAPAGRQRVPWAWPGRHRCRCAWSCFQDLSLPGQPRDRSRALADILASEGIGPRRGAWASSAGRRYADPGWLEVPAFLVDALRAAVGPDGRVENANDLFIDPADGLRTVNEVEQLAAFEYAACHTSEGVKRLLFGLRPGHDRAGGRAAAGLERGSPLLPPHALERTASQPRAAQPDATAASSDGDRFTTAFGIWGALDCRAGFVVEDAARAAGRASGTTCERLVAPYFAAIAEWLTALHVGQTGGALQAIIDRHLGDPFFGIFLNPGHLIGLDEWVHSPVWRGSIVALRSGMALQVDVIPATGTEYFTTNIEGGLALADEELRATFAARFPEAWRRISARREFMRDALGIELHPDVLPFSNLPAYLPPFLLAAAARDDRWP